MVANAAEHSLVKAKGISYTMVHSHPNDRDVSCYQRTVQH